MKLVGEWQSHVVASIRKNGILIVQGFFRSDDKPLKKLTG